MKSTKPSTLCDHLLWLNKFYDDFSNITVLDALDILCTALRCDRTMFKTTKGECFITDLYCDETVFNLPAQCFILEWFGGPPKNGQWFRASMLALVVDYCLLAMENGWTERVCNALGMAKSYGQKKPVSA